MTVFDPQRPFVLLDDASPGGRARLFTGLKTVIDARNGTDVRTALGRLHAAGGFRAGFIGFDAGYALEPVLNQCRRKAGDGLPLLWFGVFDRVERVDPQSILNEQRAYIGELEPSISEATYRGRVADVLDRVAAGDLYQANITFAATVEVAGHPLALYRRLRAAAAAPYCALIYTGDAWLLSFSPELFFKLQGDRVTTRPMKGTAPRGATADTDDAAALALAADPKNRAENLMIVDLLRNDLARIAEAGSVAVPALFAVERYPTLLQMTSTVTATTRSGAVEVLTALFPCGSVTGAPKIAAMAAIAAIEGVGRGVYTGSIGAIEADGDAEFNVAIRTLTLTSPGRAKIGLGAGIVADSVPADEWTECIAKAAFLHRGPPPDIIETMRLEHGRAVDLDRHLARAAATARFLGYHFPTSAIAAAVRAASCVGGKLRLVVAPSGAFAIEVGPPPVAPMEPVPVALVALPVARTDWRLRHKTTDRAFYDAARAASGVFEVIFVAPDGSLTEGSFTNIFIPGDDGVLRTPPLTGGLLPGILRAALLDEGRAVEASLAPADLAGGFLIGNALRGLVAACLA